MNRFRCIRENKGYDQYKIVFENNQNYVLARIRFEKSGPYGPGWNVRCSECDEDLERRVRALFHKNGRNCALPMALETFRQAYEELDNEAVIDQATIEAWAA